MRRRRALSISILTMAAAVLVPLGAVTMPMGGGAAAAASAAKPRSGTTCWQKRAYYQARNPGLKETLGSGTRYSAPCVLSAFVAIERATAEFGVPWAVDPLIRISACESLLQPSMIGKHDREDVGLFQWNDRAPHHWWTTIRKGFDEWQDRKAARSHGTYAAHHSTPDRLDPYNAARVAAWVVLAQPRSWRMTWLCKGVYDPELRRFH
jgi:hypothetical protein